MSVWSVFPDLSQLYMLIDEQMKWYKKPLAI